MQLLLDLWFCFLEGRKLHRTLVLELDHVPAELRVYGRIGHLAFLELGDGLTERRNIPTCRCPIEVTAAGFRALVLGLLRSDFLEVRALLDLRDDVLGLILLFDQDVASAVFLAPCFCLDAIVFLSHYILTDREGSQVILQVGVDQDALPLDYNLRSDFRVFVQPFLRRFLSDDFSVD